MTQEGVLLQLLTPSTALTVMILIILLGAWRLISMADALGTAGPRGAWRRPAPLATFLVLALVVVSSHAGAASLTWSFYDAGKDIFVGVQDPDAAPSPSLASIASLAPGQTAPPATPTPSGPLAQPRINILLTGIDSSAIRSHALTDTLIVASIDPKTGSVAMVSFPRDLARVRAAGWDDYNGKINSLMSYAAAHPDRFPDGPFPTLIATSATSSASRSTTTAR